MLDSNQTYDFAPAGMRLIDMVRIADDHITTVGAWSLEELRNEVGDLEVLEGPYARELPVLPEGTQPPVFPLSERETQTQYFVFVRDPEYIPTPLSKETQDLIRRTEAFFANEQALAYRARHPRPFRSVSWP